MPRDWDVPYLKPVPRRDRPVSQPVARQPAQAPLFRDRPAFWIGLVDMSGVSGSGFCEIVGDARPSWIFDLRAVPRFDVGSLTRRVAFDVFARHGAEYHDVAGMLQLRAPIDASVNAGIVADFLSQFLKFSPRGPCRLFVLLDDPATVAISADVFPRQLQPRPADGWHVEFYGLREEERRG